MESRIFGVSALGVPIFAYEFGLGPKVFVVGGVHGDEVEGVQLASALVSVCAQAFPYQLQLTVVPALNVDGVMASERRNSRGVDLNRNLPTSDWTAEVAQPRYNPGPSPGSEPENQALISYLNIHKPNLIISLHSWKPCLNVNGNCRRQADVIASFTGYEIIDTIGYPTPGCLGTYAGLEREMPTITYEIERGLRPPALMDIHLPALLEALKLSERAH